MSLLTRVRGYAARHHMWRPGTRVVAAVSGGSDSVAMLWLLHDLHRREELQLAAVAHLNHQIRADAADDEAFCLALANRVGVPFASSRVDVPVLARARRQSLELAGRLARRSFLDGVRQSAGADVIATAHTHDDQAETVLMRLFRGSGLRGLSGIDPNARHRIRPVLFATRAELRHELSVRGEAWHEDSSNSDLGNPRNRIRHELIPYLERHFNPSVRDALTRAADLSRVDQQWLERVSVAASLGVVERSSDHVSVDATRFGRLNRAVQRRVAMHALSLTSCRAASYADVLQFVERMEHFAGKRVLVSEAESDAPFSVALPVPGVVQTDAGWIVEAESFDLPRGHLRRPDVAQIDAAIPRGGLVVRNRRRGDRLRPVGLGGSKKLQDVFVDRKVPRWERDTVPIVTDGDDRIIWVAGHVLNEEFRVTEGTKGVIILKLRRI